MTRTHRQHGPGGPSLQTGAFAPRRPKARPGAPTFGRSLVLAAVLATLAVLGLRTPSALAQQFVAHTINWGPAQNITGDADVDTAGTLVYAYNWNDANINNTVNGVTFEGTNVANGDVNFPPPPGDIHISGGLNAGNIFGSTAAPFANLSPNYQNVLSGADYWSTDFVTLDRLHAGEAYSVQFWVNDSPRTPASTQSYSSMPT